MAEAIGLELTFLDENDAVLERLGQSQLDAKEWFDLRASAEQLSLTDGFDRLLSLDSVRLELYDHQRTAIFRVLREMRGRAVLADEVGLGKTIEAGIILKEYMLRSLVKRVLILVPASLVAQWQRELAYMLEIPVRIGRRPEDFVRNDRVLASIDKAKAVDCRDAVWSAKWDMVIVDEAHRLKNRKTLNWQFVNGIQKKYLLLLTATPIQNDLRELYNLVTLLKPGQLKTFTQFKRGFMLDKHSPKNTTRLKERLREVMVRTGRRESLIPFPDRQVHTIRLALGDAERAFYDRVLDELQTAYQAMPDDKKNVLPLILVLREACSHPKAALRTLRAMRASGTLRTLTQRALLGLEDCLELVAPAKLRALVELLRSTNEKAVIFTEFRLTQQEIVAALNEAGMTAISFHGGMSAKEKEEAIVRFKERGDTLVSTESGAEGRNLQFCRHVVNFDLPWNPMRVEQRIGRVHRLGQSREVRVTNLVSVHTIDSYVLELLDKKLGMFERVIGEVDEILSRFEGDFEGAIGQAALTSRSARDLDRKFEALGKAVEDAYRRYDGVRRLNVEILDGLPEGADADVR